MLLTILGAAHEVTGSCFCLEACGKRILIDCGLEQGPDEYERQEIPVSPADVDAVLLTHAHIDHSGRLPLLYRQGFRGAIHATGATADLCDIMLRDSAHIQMFEAEWRNRKGKRAGRDEYVPLYDMEDAVGAVGCFAPHHYGEMVQIADGIRARFVDVGHLLGSSSIEVWADEEGQSRKIVFSGDIGNLNQPLIRDPEYIAQADYVVMESTYGDRLHGGAPDFTAELASIIQNTFDRGGNVVIPSFAVGRTQELLYFLRKIKADGLVRGHARFPVFVDSPLAIEATGIFNANTAEYFDEDALALARSGINPLQFDDLEKTVTSDESRAINDNPSSKVIISASGMCEAGRIKHHLKHNLWHPQNTILFVGYQAVGTLGRLLIEGADKVKLFGEEINVRAEIRQLQGISGHADRNGLLKWIQSFEEKPRRVVVIHGDNDSCEAFKNTLRDEYHFAADAPYPGARYDLISNACLYEGTRERKRADAPTRRGSDVYARLIAAGKRLVAIIRHNEGSANKDLARFADQVTSLCDKWER